MKALLLEISFFDAHFKVHYTKGFRLTYPIPLPTSVAGIFGALLGIERIDILEEFKDFSFGAKVKGIKSIRDNFENASFIQIPWKKSTWPPGVAPIQILQEPTYIIAIASRDEKIYQILQTLRKGFVFLPYGGQNDYFVKDIKILDIKEIYNAEWIENYAPKSRVIKTEIILEESILSILPVMHKNSHEFFYFSNKVKLHLKDKCPAVDGIGLYELSQFFYPSQ